MTNPLVQLFCNVLYVCIIQSMHVMTCGFMSSQLYVHLLCSKAVNHQRPVPKVNYLQGIANK